MAEDTDDSREQGIEFGALAEDLEDETYPIAHDELVENYGDRELGLPNGTETLQEILGPENEGEYENAEDVRQAVFNMVGGEAVGRQGYSDRGAGTAERESDEESF